MESLNRMATDLVDEAIDFADELNVSVHPLDNDATVLDFGVEIPGGIEAGLLLAEIQTAGLATVGSTLEPVGDAALTHVELSTDHPALALLCGQKAGWELSVDDFEGLGAGPARALVADEEIYQRIGYRDAFDFAVLSVESDAVPDEAVVEYVADVAGVAPSGVFVPAYAAASLTGSVQMAARAAELAVFRLSELGYDPLSVLAANASAPVAPVAADEETAIARTNDALAYGGRVHLVVEDDFERFDEVPSVATAEYDRPFADIFADADWDFHDVPAGLFAPAQVTVDVRGGPTHVVGQPNTERLVESFDKPVPEPLATGDDTATDVSLDAALAPAHRAVPLVPEAVDDCCLRLQTRLDLSDRQTARDWLPFLTALGLVTDTDRGYRRRRQDLDRAALAQAFEERVFAAEDVLAALEAGDPLSADEVFEQVRGAVPRWERNRRDDWAAVWRTRVRRLLDWAVLFGLAERVAGGYVAVSDASEEH
jgi:methenyltetrahydromethanopterin cyclohydrolase